MNHAWHLLAAAVMMAFTGCATVQHPVRTAPADHGEKLVIAHRGASGYLPEHTLEGYAMAHAQGAHYVEPDVVMTADGVLIALHDLTLEATTNVQEIFPNRTRHDGRWYAADFTFLELQMLSVHERTRDSRQVYPGRFPADTALFRIPSLEQIIQLIQGLNTSTGRNVGIYPEIKSSRWHRDQGLFIEEALLDLLNAYGYEGPKANIFIQSFEPESLLYLRNTLGADMPLVQLISARQSHLTTAAALDKIATYADGIGPSKALIEDVRGSPVRNLFLVTEAHARGLVVHPYTFRADQLPRHTGSLEEELERFLYVYGVDGVFVDFPDAAVRVINETVGE